VDWVGLVVGKSNRPYDAPGRVGGRFYPFPQTRRPAHARRAGKTEQKKADLMLSADFQLGGLPANPNG
jgi:hypothetical protein